MNVSRKASPQAVRRGAQRGMAMVEALVAVLILAIGLIGTLGMQTRAQTALAEAAMRAEATIAANRLIGLINTDLDNLASYSLASGGTPSAALKQWYDSAVTSMPNGSASVAIAPADDAETTSVVIDIRWKRNAQSQANSHRITTYVARKTTT